MSTNQESWQVEDGELLKSQREEAGIDRSVFARFGLISTMQLKQLEVGGETAFYSQTIKYQIGKKLLHHFGVKTMFEKREMEQKSVVPENETQAKIDETKLQIVEAFGNVLSTTESALNTQIASTQNSITTSKFKRNSLISVLACVLAVLITNVFFLHQSEPPVALKKEQEKVKDSEIKEIQANQVQEIKDTSSTTSSGSKSTEQSSASVNAQVDMKNCLWTSSPLSLKLPMPTKASEYIYLIASTDASFCVMDGVKKITTNTLRAGDSQTIKGQPPFRLYSEKIADLKIFFEGNKVVLQGNEVTDVILGSTNTKQ